MKKRILGLVVAVIMIAGMFVGCGKGNGDKIVLNVAYMPNYGSLWAIENAIEQGFLADENIKVNLVEFQDGPTIIAAMESGSIDMGYIGQGAHKLCINGQATIFALSHISNGDMLIGGPGIASVEDLAGKKVLRKMNFLQESRRFYQSSGRRPSDE